MYFSETHRHSITSTQTLHKFKTLIHSTQGWCVVTGIHDVESEAVISSSIEIGKINTTREWDNKDKQGNIIHNIEVTEQDPQAVGSIITYYRRYNLLQLLDLKTEDDDGASGSPRAKNASTSNETPTQAQNTRPDFKTDVIDRILQETDSNVIDTIISNAKWTEKQIEWAKKTAYTRKQELKNKPPF